MRTLKVGTACVEPGKIGFGKLLLEPLPDGAEIFVPLIVVNGIHDGPVLWMGSCIHGGEIPGIEVSRRITREIVDPRTLRGAIIAATILDPYAFRHRRAFAPQDDLNLNAVFPGNPEGTVSERAAHVIFTEGVSHADYAIDFHAATPLGTEFMCLPACADPQVMARSLEIATAFGFPITEITRDMFGYDHSLIGLAQDNGKPGFVCEVKAQQRFFRSSIPAGVRGILNVMKCIGMIDGEIEPQSDIIGTGATVRFVDFRPMKSGLVTFSVTGGQFVDRGERLGTVRDIWGNVVDEIKSPTSGYIRTVTDNQAVYAGQIVGTILEPHPRETLWTRARKT